MKLQQRIWAIVQAAAPDDKKSRLFDIFILTLIFLNVLAVVLSTVNTLARKFHAYFFYFEVFSVAVFTLEYLARIWSCVADPRYRHPLWGRIRFARTFLAMVDLLAILPFYLPYVVVDLRFVRIFRLLRIFVLAKAAKYVSSLRLFANVFKSKRQELALASFIMLLVLIFTSSLMFMFETSVQPEKFPDIPSTMWWAIATLTTVGYGDVYPITPVGKLLGSISAILGIGLFALPAGILCSGFLEELQQLRFRKEKRCPYCGNSIQSEESKP